jgi:sarcosine oxidase subunit gamma
MLAPVGIVSAWNVQGAGVVPTASELFGVQMPEAPNTITSAREASALWLGPGSWLVVSGGAPLDGFEAKRDVINAAGGALFDVSAGRVAYALAGARAIDVLAAGCPLDFHPLAFAPRCCVQSVYGRVSALVVRPRDEGAFVIMVARSFGRDVWHGLISAAAEWGGYEVCPAQPWPGPGGS